jgi:hypothetical protein
MPRMMQQGTMWSCQLNTMCQSVQPPRGNIAIISHAEGYAPDVYTSILTNLSVCRSSKHFQTMASSLQVNASESKTVDISHVWAPQASIPGCWETENCLFYLFATGGLLSSLYGLRKRYTTVLQEKTTDLPRSSSTCLQLNRLIK